MRRVLASLALGFAAMTGGAASAQMLRFADLDQWQADDHLAALETFRRSCDLVEGEEWKPLCALAADIHDPAKARDFFELFFRPMMVGQTPALFTGYYEPELAGSLTQSARFSHPVYRRPPELRDGQPYLTRAQIQGGALRGRGLELVWLEDPVEAFFLQVQGSGRIRLPDGSMIRLGYDGRNGHGYQSVGQEMIRRGTHSPDQVSAQAIKSYVRDVAGTGLLNVNPSYVFFRKIDGLGPQDGPIGAMTRPITPLRTVAVDPAFTPLGVPVWVEKDGTAPMRRLMVAQDTGGAIKGAQRADIFYGTGDQAGDQAGTVKDGGRMIQLLPIERAYALLSDG